MSILLPVHPIVASPASSYAADEQEMLVFLNSMKNQLMHFGTDAGYATHLKQGLHPALLADIYHFDGAAAIDNIFSRLDYRETKNPVRWLRKRKTVRLLTRLSQLTSAYYLFFQANLHAEPAWQDQRHAQAITLQQLLLHAKFKITPVLEYDEYAAKNAAYAILDFLSIPDILDIDGGLENLRNRVRHMNLTQADLGYCAKTFTHVMKQIARCKPRGGAA